MSEQNKQAVATVKDLVIGVKHEENTGELYRFQIDYGSFEIYPGDFILIKGHNGSGKSTFLRLFHMNSYKYFDFVRGGLIFHDTGFPEDSIQRYSNDMHTNLKCAITFIGQEERFLSSDSAYSYIFKVCETSLQNRKNNGMAYTRAQKQELRRRIDGMIREYYDRYLEKSFGCKDYSTFKRKNVRDWSGGQQKMINVLAGIIKARICEVRLVLMDEPLNNLDGKNKAILNRLISDLRREQPIAIVAITHCLIFEGVNRVLTLVDERPDLRRAVLTECSEDVHKECLENYY